jgi:hypothetical protein
MHGILFRRVSFSIVTASSHTWEVPERKEHRVALAISCDDLEHGLSSQVISNRGNESNFYPE